MDNFVRDKIGLCGRGGGFEVCFWKFYNVNFNEFELFFRININIMKNFIFLYYRYNNK